MQICACSDDSAKRPGRVSRFFRRTTEVVTTKSSSDMKIERNYSAIRHCERPERSVAKSKDAKQSPHHGAGIASSLTPFAPRNDG